MRKKRIMVVGAERVGKTSLVNHLNDYTGPLRRRQDIIYTDKTIDVPSAFLEHRSLIRNTITISQDAWCVLILISQSNPKIVYSHGFVNALLCKNVIGVITKSDQNLENKAKCEAQLKSCDIKPPYFSINNLDESGIEDLKEYLKKLQP